MLARVGIREEAQEIVEVAKLEVAQQQPFRLNPWSGREPAFRVVERKQVE
jgi:hypothetical protein